MHIVKFILVFLILLVNGPMIAVAQNRIAVIPFDTSLLPIVIPPDEVVPVELEPVELDPVELDPVYLEDAIGKPIVWNRGWDTNIGHKTKIDPTVTLSFTGLSGLYVTYNAPEIKHWGLQQYFQHPKRIYGKAVLLIDRGDLAEGGAFEWTKNNQPRVSLINIVRTDHNGPAGQAWVRNWIDPRPGDKVWYFIMSDDEKLSSNPFHFIWPASF